MKDVLTFFIAQTGFLAILFGSAAAYWGLDLWGFPMLLGAGLIGLAVFHYHREK